MPLPRIARPAPLALAVVLAAALAGCRAHKGTIIAKQHIPESCLVQIAPMLLADRHQAERGRIPLLRLMPEQWLIHVKQPDGTVELYDLRSQAAFDALAVGDFYKYDAKTARPAPGPATLRLAPDEFQKVQAAPGQFETPATEPAPPPPG